MVEIKKNTKFKPITLISGFLVTSVIGALVLLSASHILLTAEITATSTVLLICYGSMFLAVLLSSFFGIKISMFISRGVRPILLKTAMLISACILTFYWDTQINPTSYTFLMDANSGYADIAIIPLGLYLLLFIVLCHFFQRKYPK